MALETIHTQVGGLEGTGAGLQHTICSAVQVQLAVEDGTYSVVPTAWSCSGAQIVRP